MSTGDIRTEDQARAILKLAPDAPASVWRAAFQRAVKTAHPDQGGDGEQVRLVIEAYRFLKSHDGARPGVRFEAGPRPPRPAPRPQARAETAPPSRPPPEPAAP